MASVKIVFPGRRGPPPTVRCRICGYRWQLKKKLWVKRLGKLPIHCARKTCRSTTLEVVN